MRLFKPQMLNYHKGKVIKKNPFKKPQTTQIYLPEGKVLMKVNCENPAADVS